jgi:C-terminal processing protease CtpA/Prc
MKAAAAKVHWAGKMLGLRFLKDPEFAEVRLDYFIGDDFPQWIEDTFKTLREKGTKTLIVDLRGNGGGEDMYGAKFVSYLTDKPFHYFDHINVKTIHPSFKDASDWNPAEEARLRAGTVPDPRGGYLVTPQLHPGLAVQSPGKYPFLGKTIVLIDGGTFSTAADVCAVLHHLKRATFVGEETGGGYYGNNSGPMPTVTLPISKLKLRLPMYEYWNAVPGYAGERRGTLPDYPAPNTVSGLLKGVDAPLDLALKLANGTPLPQFE